MRIFQRQSCLHTHLPIAAVGLYVAQVHLPGSSRSTALRIDRDRDLRLCRNSPAYAYAIERRRDFRLNNTNANAIAMTNGTAAGENSGTTWTERVLPPEK